MPLCLPACLPPPSTSLRARLPSPLRSNRAARRRPQVQLTAHDWVPSSASARAAGGSAPVRAYLQEWSANMSAGLARALSPASANGVFAAACWIHTGFTPSSPTIGGEGYVAAFTRWLRGEPVKLHDDCGILCNPTCAH